MKTIGVLEAERDLSALLRDVERGEEVTITREGKPVARMVPPAAPAGQESVSDLERTVAEMKAARVGVTLGGLDWKELRDEGRR